MWQVAKLKPKLEGEVFFFWLFNFLGFCGDKGGGVGKKRTSPVRKRSATKRQSTGEVMMGCEGLGKTMSLIFVIVFNCYFY